MKHRCTSGPASPKQHGYLKRLAISRGTTYENPCCSRHASHQITQLQLKPSVITSERETAAEHLEQRNSEPRTHLPGQHAVIPTAGWWDS